MALSYYYDSNLIEQLITPQTELITPNYQNFDPNDFFNYSPETPNFGDCFPGNTSCGSAKKESSLSAQSLAARKRRRRITVKTQELGKLVPGGHKMNTAEMLQAAYKYVKFLQAQVGILELAAAYYNQESFECDEELRILLESSVIQEKLCSSEKCLVPEEFVQMIGICWDDRKMLKQEH